METFHQPLLLKSVTDSLGSHSDHSRSGNSNNERDRTGTFSSEYDDNDTGATVGKTLAVNRQQATAFPPFNPSHSPRPNPTTNLKGHHFGSPPLSSLSSRPSINGSLISLSGSTPFFPTKYAWVQSPDNDFNSLPIQMERSLKRRLFLVLTKPSASICGIIYFSFVNLTLVLVAVGIMVCESTWTVDIGFNCDFW